MTDFLIFRTVPVTEFAFPLDFVVQRPPQILPIQIADRFSPKHPFLFGDVVFPELPSMFEHPLEYPAMGGHKAVSVECKSVCGENFLDIGRCLVTLCGIVGAGCPSGLAVIIGVKHLPDLINGDVALNVALRHIQQILRRLQTVNLLKADGCLPVGGTLPCRWLNLPDIFVKILLPH